MRKRLDALPIGQGGQAIVTTTQLTPAASKPSVFTLVFPGGLVAVLEIRGAASLEAARTIAEQAVRRSPRINLRGETIETPANYLVLDGDVSGGHAACICSWNCNAHECQPDFRPAPERNSLLGRDAEGECQ